MFLTLLLYVPRASSFISTHFSLLNLDYLAYCLRNLLFFDISLLYYCINLRSSIIFCLSFGDITLCLGFYLSCSVVSISELFCCEFFKTLEILLVILLPIKLPVASAVFLSASVINCLA